MANRSFYAPLYEALLKMSHGGGLRLHIPGHKGRGLGSVFDGVFSVDYTEITNTGNLYGEGGIIQQAEREAARYFGMDRCFFLTCGASQGIKAALGAFCGGGGAVVLDRNCHQSAFDACIMLGLDPAYAIPEIDSSSGLSRNISPDNLAAAVKNSSAKAALVTSPTYYGYLLDIAALAKAAHSAGAALIVDAAHGSHLRACGAPDPCAQGADAVIYSAHKTLFALGQGAYLLARGKDEAFYAGIRRMTALFGTTSPSYPVMASLDYARAWLEAHPAAYPGAAQLCADTAQKLASTAGFDVISPTSGFDPCRLVVSVARLGISGTDCADLLHGMGIEAEMADERHVVMVITPADTADDMQRLTNAFSGIKPCEAAARNPALPPPLPHKAIPPRQAYFSPCEAVPLGKSVGRTAAQSISPYPPGVPVVACGEIIDKVCVEYLLEKSYNVNNKIIVVA